MSEQRWAIYVCDRCGSHDAIASAPDLGVVQCRACSIQWLKEEALTIEVIPAGSVQAVAEKLHDLAADYRFAAYPETATRIVDELAEHLTSLEQRVRYHGAPMTEQKWPERVYVTEECWGSDDRTEVERDFPGEEIRTYIPAESVQAVAERLREIADDINAAGFIGYARVLRDDLADQLTSLYERDE